MKGRRTSGGESRLFQLGLSLAWGLFLGIGLSVDFRQSALSPADQRLGAFFHQFGTLGMILPLLLAFLYDRARPVWKKHSPRKNVCLGVTSGLFGLANALGQQMYYTDHLPGSLLSGFIFALYAVSGAVAFFLVVTLLTRFLPALLADASAPRGAEHFRRFRVLAFCVILAGWLPWIISYYPCSADWDAYYPMAQYLGMSPKSNHHPWFYCMNVGLCYSLGVSAGDRNLGLFLYVFLRAILMALIYSELAVRIRKAGLRPLVSWAVVLFFSVVPVWGAYAKHAFKDTLCSALFCLFVMETISVVRHLRDGAPGYRPFLLYSVSALLVSLYRNNCVYVVALVTVLLLIAALSKQRRGRARGITCALLALGILLYGGYRVYIQTVEHVKPASPREALSIPFQQTARTVRDHAEEITAEEREGISGLFDFDQLGTSYDPLITDPVKNSADHIPEHGLQYLKTWFSMAFRFPVSYLEAALAESYGYYALTPDQALHAGNWNCGMTIFNWVKDPRFEDDFTGDYLAALQGVRDFLDDWAATWHQLPLLGLSDLKALYTWLAVLAGALLIWKRRWMEAIPVCGILLMILTCCASPVNDCFRYFAPAAAATPALLLLLPAAREGFARESGHDNQSPAEKTGPGNTE